MKKYLAVLLAFVLVFAFVSCTSADNKAGEDVTANENENEKEEVPETNEDEGVGVKVMTYDEYVAAEVDAPVVIETYVQATQSWWENKITCYTETPDGAYFLYNMACSEEDAAKLVPGTKIRVTGFKGEWAGEVEVAEGATFEFVDGDTYIAEPKDVTELLGTDELIKSQNQLVTFCDMTVKGIEYKNEPGTDDIYVTLTKGENEYSFCVEYYLTNNETDVYKAVQSLSEGDVVDITGFLYWYEGVNTHITAVTVK